MFWKKKKGKICPLIKGVCIEGDCQFWVHMYGRDGNSDKTIDVFDCSFRWLPNLMTEVRASSDRVASSVQDFRNHMINQNQDMLTLEKQKVDLFSKKDKETING